MTTQVLLDSADLLDSLIANPWGQVSPSVYETARLIALTPWLTGHSERVAFILGTQRADGAWGPSSDDGYALVPTLSATDALLSIGARAPANAGLRALRRLMSDRSFALPDTPAIELIVLALVRSINRRLPSPRVRTPLRLTPSWLEEVTALLTADHAVPQKLFHALEVGGPTARAVTGTRLASTGAIGASPAATAAWLGPTEPPASNPARRYLEAAVATHGGPVPCALPVTVFERAWVLSWLQRAGVPTGSQPRLTDSLLSALGRDGTAASEGLPPDADTTAGVLFALASLGSAQDPGVLRSYELDTHFCTWPGEQGESITTNAHVLEAFGAYVAAHPATWPSHADAIHKVTAWLCAQQRPDGSWLDRWHVSPYYATFCAAIALARYGNAEESVRRAVRWLVRTQRSDGSWGLWTGTVEETAYAVQTLLLLGQVHDEVVSGEVIRPAHDYLLRSSDHRDGPAMWHDKDLYRPHAIVRAAVLAALHLASSDHHVSHT